MHPIIWLLYCMVVSCMCRKLPTQNILCKTKPRFVFSFKDNHLCAHTCIHANLKSLLVRLAQPLPIAKVYFLPPLPADAKLTFCLSEGRKTKTKRSNPQCLVPCFHLTFSSASLNKEGRHNCSCLQQPLLGPHPLKPG